MADKAVFICNCINCEKPESHEYPFDGYQAYRSGARIKDALPECNAFEREFLISKLCFDCQSKIFHRPKPGESWGAVVGECEVCGCTIYENDNNKCPQCNYVLGESE